MVHTYLCIPELPILEVAGMETFAILHFGIFMPIWYFYANVVFLWQFGIFCIHICICISYIYSRSCMMYHEKSGNPVPEVSF
jgi:hypothetical protein